MLPNGMGRQGGGGPLKSPTTIEDQIRLGWTSHQGTMLSVFEDFLSAESMVDVTLACEGQYIRAHKVILAACSPYFHLLNADMNNKHPIFFLKDVKFTELKALLQFMYRGEVNISRGDFASLLAVAQALQIRGLAEVDNTNKRTPAEPDVRKHAARMEPQAPPPRHLPEPVTTASANHFVLPRNLTNPNYYEPARITSIVTATAPVAVGESAPSSIQPPSGENWRSVPATNVHPTMLPISPMNLIQRLSTPAQLDSLQISPARYQAAPHAQQAQQAEVLMIKEPVKVEEIMGSTLVDLTAEDDHENSMSQSSNSSFSEYWQIRDGEGQRVENPEHSFRQPSQPKEGVDLNSFSGNNSNHDRHRRRRTLFKQNQLRTLHSYFGMNRNPNHDDLVKLSGTTGLNKVVLQVWFQNARAKWRNLARNKRGATKGTYH